MKKRILKALVYRLVSVGITASIAYFTTSDFKISAVVGASDAILKTIWYFLFDYIWEEKN